MNQKAMKNQTRAEQARLDQLYREWTSELASHLAETLAYSAPESRSSMVKTMLYKAFKMVEDRARNGIQNGDERSSQ